MSVKIFVLFFMLPLTHVCAQDVSFQTFLSELEKSECIDSVSFGKSFDFINDAELYSKFLPQANEKCRCAQEIYDGKREVMLNTKTLLLSPYNGTVRTIKMETVSGSWRMMERTMCL